MTTRAASVPITIRGVAKAYGAVIALDDVDVDVRSGEFLTLLGPSGSGKTTLLMVLAGFIRPDRGSIRFGETEVIRLAPHKRDVGMVFQNYALYPHMTVRDNMSFSLRLANAGKATIDTQVSRAADILGLGKLLDRYPRQLSGGQRQRVAMGRAIVRNPQVFLFDEPLSNLDAKLRVQMRTEIRELHQRLKTTSVYVTHDQIEAMTMADKIVVMKDGVVEQTGGPLDLYDRPANTFVAGFIGSPAMNLLPGTVGRQGGALEAVFVDGSRLALAHNAAAQEGQTILYGIRPEHFAVGSSGGLAVEVVVVEPTGADTQIYCRFVDREVTATIRDRTNVRAGDRISLIPDAGRAHLFDAASGKRLAA